MYSSPPTRSKPIRSSSAGLSLTAATGSLLDSVNSSTFLTARMTVIERRCGSSSGMLSENSL